MKYFYFLFSDLENRNAYIRNIQTHNGMRPQDIVLLLKLIANKGHLFTLPQLSGVLFISSSEISKSLQRNQYAGLLNNDRKSVNKLALMDFLKYGLPYVFPVKSGPQLKGMPTGISHPALKKYINSNEAFVWPSSEGSIRGTSIQPLYETVPKAASVDADLYKLLSMVEVLRIGKTREKQKAEELLAQMILND